MPAKRKTATAKHPPLVRSTEALKILTELVARYDRASRAVGKAAERLATLQNEAERILVKEIPEYMAEIEVRELTLRDGRPVKCETKTYGSIKVDDRIKAHAWLRKHGHGQLIKNTVTATFGQGEQKKAESLEALVAKKGFGVKRAEAVHAGTFSAWVREMTETGKKIPPKLFGIFQKEEVTIGKPKKKARK